MRLVTPLVRRGIAVVAIGFVSVFGGRTLSAQPPSGTAGGSTSGLLFDALAQMDSVLFDASFVSCDADKANAIFSEDVEFYHDRTGLATGEAVRESTRKLTASCPRDRGVVRMIVPGTLRVHRLKDYGAVQTGMHRFVETGNPSSEVAEFVHVWHKTAQGWRLVRVLSFDHHSPTSPVR